MANYTLKVLSIKKETNDTVTVYFKQPALKKIKYRPGQYLTLVLRINGRRYLRPYSFSSAPGIDETLSITVKRMLGGIVSNHILDQLKPGDLIEVLEPMGDFLLPENEDLFAGHLVFWGCGSGITPLFSMIKYALFHFDKVEITLIYGNRCKETTIFL
jgi:ring-1,2-phenylacetyl-CoA epoxidase subunit PaaE